MMTADDQEELLSQARLFSGAFFRLKRYVLDHIDFLDQSNDIETANEYSRYLTIAEDADKRIFQVLVKYGATK